MKIPHVLKVMATLVASAVLGGCTSSRSFDVVASSRDYQWTGVAASQSGRMFVSYPRWNQPFDLSVAELGAGGPNAAALKAYPDEAWNKWDPRLRIAPGNRFVCVQAVHVDQLDRMWILDPASPQFGGVVPGEAKLVQVDLAKNEVVKVINFDATIAPKESYLNDIRVDTEHDVAYITDSGKGGIVVVDLKTGKAWRALDGHPSVLAEDISIVIDGKPVLGADGKTPRVNSDGIALSADGKMLYYQALTGRTLYRISTGLLLDEKATPGQVADGVERVGETVVTDGMEIDALGNVYFTAIEKNAVMARRPDGEMVTIAQGPEISWPDSFAWRGNGTLYVSTAQIHRTTMFNGGKPGPTTPYNVIRVQPIGPRMGCCVK